MQGSRKSAGLAALVAAGLLAAGCQQSQAPAPAPTPETAPSPVESPAAEASPAADASPADSPVK